LKISLIMIISADRLFCVHSVFEVSQPVNTWVNIFYLKLQTLKQADRLLLINLRTRDFIRKLFALCETADQR